MTSRKPLVIAAAFGSVAGLALAIQVRAGGDKVAFPENYAAGLLYNTVDRYDVKQYREQAEYHLTRIAAICGTDCAEYRSLAEALEKPPGTSLVY